MKSWFGSWFDSLHEEPVEVTVLAGDKHMTIGLRREDASIQTHQWAMRDLNVTFDHSRQSTLITNPGQAQNYLLIEGREALQYIEELQAEWKKPWYRKNRTKDWVRNLGIFAGICAVLVTAYLLVVPWLSEKIATTIEPGTEQRFGNAIYNALALNDREDKVASATLNDFFAAMDVKTVYDVRITVVESNIVNAFALPGGNIVVYTGLLHQLNAYPELAALLSHEFVHVNNKHATRSIFRKLGSRIFLGLVFGNFGSVTSVLIDKADEFKSLKYSRSLEKEADQQGLSILLERKIDPEGFSALFNRLRASAPASAMPEFFASHPDIQKRIDYIRETSRNAAVEESHSLKTIFEKLK